MSDTITQESIRPSSSIINALATYIELTKPNLNENYTRCWHGSVTLVPMPCAIEESKILTHDESKNIDLMHEYMDTFFGYEEYNIITSQEWNSGRFPLKKMVDEGMTSIPPAFYMLLEKYCKDNDINQVDLPFIIGCLIVTLGLNDQLGRNDEYESMENWFVSRFEFDLKYCFKD